MQASKPTKLPVNSIDWAKLISSMGRANRAIARFDGILNHLENPDLLLGPLTTREAVLSSKIEGTVVTVGEVMLFEAGDAPESESRRFDIEEVINYRRALRVADSEMATRPFSLNLMLKLHRTLLASVRGYNKAPGKFRTVQNHIGKINSRLDEADFIPPSPEDLMPSLHEWEKYYHSDEIDTLGQLAVVHAQFEFLHPFLDGNGRIGRILVPLFLYERHILSRPCFYLSEYLEEHRDEYVCRLRDLERTPDAWTNWCIFFLDALATQADRNAAKVQAILDLYKNLKHRVLELTNSRFAVPILDSMFSQPIFTTTSMLAGEGMPHRPMLMRLLAQLTNEGIISIRVESSGRRPAIYECEALVDLCDSTQPRARRRRNKN